MTLDPRDAALEDRLEGGAHEQRSHFRSVALGSEREPRQNAAIAFDDEVGVAEGSIEAANRLALHGAPVDRPSERGDGTGDVPQQVVSPLRRLLAKERLELRGSHRAEIDDPKLRGGDRKSAHRRIVYLQCARERTTIGEGPAPRRARIHAPMQAVILAAGRSTRTYPLTVTRPKPLVPLWGRPLVEHQIRQLAGLVDEVVLVVGFLRDQIEHRLGSEHQGVRLRYVVQQTQRGTADALLAARPFLSSRALVLNGDDFYHHDDLEGLAGLAGTHRGLLVSRASDPQNRAVVTIEDERITSIVEKPPSPPKDSWCSVGGYAIEASDLDELDHLEPSPRGELELPDFISRLVRQSKVQPWRIERFWLPLTYAWDVLGVTRFLWETKETAAALAIESESLSTLEARSDVELGRGVEIEGPLWVGRGVRIEDGAHLVGPVALGPGVRVGARARLERVVLFEEAVIEREAKVFDSVLGARVIVGAKASLSSRPGSELEIRIKDKTVVPDLPRLGTIAGDGAQIAPGAELPAGTLLAPEVEHRRA